MRRGYTEHEKQEYVKLYNHGTSVETLCRDYGLSKSSVYNWIKDYTKVKAPSGEYVTAKRLYELEKRLARINRENEIFRSSGCMPQSLLEERIQAIIRLKDEYNLHVLCDTLEVRRSTIYHRLKRSPAKTQLEQENEVLRENIKEIYEKYSGRLGSKKIRIKLMEEGFVASNERVSRLMKEMNLRGPARIHRRKRPMVDSPIRKNYLQQQFTQVAPNKAWVSDITYLNVNNVLYAICVILDLFSRKVIAYEILDDSGQELILATFQKAYNNREVESDLIFHSDQGAQYLANDFQYLLRKYKVTQSLSRAGFPYDNAVVESFFSSLKSEELNRYCYLSLEELERSVEEYISFYNNERPHQSLRYKTPQAVEDAYYQ